VIAPQVIRQMKRLTAAKVFILVQKILLQKS
jgi:hypothetical protein